MLADLLRRLLFSRPARRGWTGLLVLLAAVIVGLAMTPGSQEITPDTGLDKVEHVLAFAVLAVCGVYGLRGRPHAALKLPAGLLLLGIGIELGQTMVPGRSGGVDDVVADVVGIALGMLLALGVARLMERRREPRSDDAPESAPDDAREGAPGGAR